jgi:alkylation response protein AidB-like acyl-CoA dehydrogenase
MQHPSSIINKNIVEAIRTQSFIAEQTGELTAQQLDIIYQHSWFNLFVPKLYGGLELSLPQALRYEEAFAWMDGSFGWTITLCSGANWFVGFLDTDAANEIYLNPKVCLAGSGRPSGIAKITNDGYTVTGQWDYATGAPHASVFTANCMIEKNGELIKDENNEPLIRSFWFLHKEVSIQHNWKSSGMIATASHSFKLKDLNLPLNRTFIIDPSHAKLSNPVYQFPFAAFAECTLAVNSSGMLLHFLELFEEIITRNKKIEQKIYPPHDPSQPMLLRDLLKDFKTTFNIKRALFYDTIDKAWSTLLRYSMIDQQLLQHVGLHSRGLAFMATRMAEQLYPYAGLQAAHPESELNRIWRDMHTASQHSLLHFVFE